MRCFAINEYHLSAKLGNHNCHNNVAVWCQGLALGHVGKMSLTPNYATHLQLDLYTQHAIGCI